MKAFIAGVALVSVFGAAQAMDYVGPYDINVNEDGEVQFGSKVIKMELEFDYNASNITFAVKMPENTLRGTYSCNEFNQGADKLDAHLDEVAESVFYAMSVHGLAFTSEDLPESEAIEVIHAAIHKRVATGLKGAITTVSTMCPVSIRLPNNTTLDPN